MREKYYSLAKKIRLINKQTGRCFTVRLRSEYNCATTELCVSYCTWQTRTVVVQHRSPLGTDSSEAYRYITHAPSGVCSLQASPAATRTQAAESGAPKNAAAGTGPRRGACRPGRKRRIDSPRAAAARAMEADESRTRVLLRSLRPCLFRRVLKVVEY